MHVDPTWLTAGVSTIIPILTGIVTKLHAPDGVKAAVALFFSALTGIIIQVASSGGIFEWAASGKLFAVAFITQLAAYLGVLKPTGDTPYVPLQKVTASFGIGGSTETVENAALSSTPVRYDPLIQAINATVTPTTTTSNTIGSAYVTVTPVMQPPINPDGTPYTG